MASGIECMCVFVWFKKLLRHDVLGLAWLIMNGTFEELSSPSEETTAADLARVGRWSRTSLSRANVSHRIVRARASVRLFPLFVHVRIYFARERVLLCEHVRRRSSVSAECKQWLSAC